MTLRMRDNQNREEGYAMGQEVGRREGLQEGHSKGLQEGQMKMQRIASYLLENGRMEELKKVLSADGETIDRLCKELGLQ